MQSLVRNSWTHCWPVNKNKNSYFRGNTKDGLAIPSVWMGARAWACVCADARSKPLPTSCRRDATPQHSAHPQHQDSLSSVSLWHLYRVQVYPHRRVRAFHGEFKQREPGGWDAWGLDVPRHVLQSVSTLYVLWLAVSNN